MWTGALRVRLADETNLSCRRSSQAPRQATTAKRQSMGRKQNDVELVLGDPRHERGVWMTDEDREHGSFELGSQEFARFAQLHVGLRSHRAVVGPGPAASAAPQRSRLRRKRHNRQAAAGFGKLGADSQRRCPAAAGFKDDEHACRGLSVLTAIALDPPSIRRSHNAHEPCPSFFGFCGRG